MSKFKQTNQFTDAVSSILDFIDNYLASKMKEPVDSTMKEIIQEYVQAQVSKIMPKIEKYITESLGAEVLVRSTNQPQTSYAVAASLLEFELKKILIDEMEENKSINNIMSLYGDVVTLKRSRDDQDKDEDTSAGSNRGSKRRRSRKEVESSKELTHKESKSTSSSKGASRSQLKSSGKSAHAEEHGQKILQLAQAIGIQSLFNKFLATLIDFSAFIMHRLKIENLTQEVLTGETYDLIKGTCKNVVELEYHLEEDYFINNDLEYLKGESSSQKYTTSVTKTKAADYGQVKWIEDKVHLEEIIVRREDDQLYKFREGDFKILRRQDIEDMLLLLVQGKGEYMWEKFYQRTVNMVSRHTEHHLAELNKNPNFNATYNLYGFAWAFKERGNEAWFMASVDFIQGLTDQDGNFLQDDEERGNCIEHHNRMCGDTEDGNFVERVDETICQKINQVSVEEGDGVLDSEGDGVHLSQTSDVVQQVKGKYDEFDELTKRFSKFETSETFVMFKSSLKTDVCTKNQSTDFNLKESELIPNFCSDHNDISNHIGAVSNEAKQPSSSFSHPENDEYASHLDDLMETDVEKANDDYNDDRILCIIKPNDACDEVEVDNFEDNYMLMLNDEEKPVKSSLNDMELKQEPEKIAVKQGILEQQPNAAKGKNCFGGNCRSFWLSLSCLNSSKTDWLNDHAKVDGVLAKKMCLMNVLDDISQGDVTRVYRPKDIINDLNIDLNIDVSYKRAWKGKQLAVESNQGCPIALFAQLPYYCYNLKLANENTVTHIETDDEGRFKMLFIGFGVSILLKAFVDEQRIPVDKQTTL
ncbi:hypothetical protein Tco_0893733 [Tanacetum coccineum]|uniref:Uncharacterized protein n=1 Tax=Tanacetum coccineum TaxID=301880 RepID=A0ABQ5C9P4_9ASTR